MDKIHHRHIHLRTIHTIHQDHFFDRFIFTIAIQIPLNQRIRINKTTPLRIIIPAAQIIQSSFYIIDIPPITEWLDRTQSGSERASSGKYLAPRIVSVFYNFRTSAVNDADDIAL